MSTEWTTESVLAKLAELGDPRAVKVWAKLGFDTTNYYGVNLTKLNKLARKIKKNHDLALQIWRTGKHDARLLATLIEEPKLITRQQINDQSKDFDFFDLSDYYCRHIIAKTEFVKHYITQWQQHENEYIERSAWILLSEFAKSGKSVPDEFFLPYLENIRENIQQARNWVKEAMLYALISMGAKSTDLNAIALQVTSHTGKIDIDYGDTSCQAPDPVKSLTSEKTRQKINING